MMKMDEILKSLECPVCYRYMIDQISLCKAGHSICESCKNQLSTEKCPTCRESMVVNRNYALEEIAKNIIYTCKNEGCKKKFKSKNVKLHEKTCGFGLHKCPLHFTKCTWNGKISEFPLHVQTHHDNYLNNWIAIDKSYCQVLIFQNEIFVAFTHVTSSRKHYSCVYNGNRKVPEAFCLEITFVDPRKETAAQYELKLTIPCKTSFDAFDNIFVNEQISLTVDSLNIFKTNDEADGYATTIKILEMID